MPASKPSLSRRRFIVGSERQSAFDQLVRLGDRSRLGSVIVRDRHGAGTAIDIAKTAGVNLAHVGKYLHSLELLRFVRRTGDALALRMLKGTLDGMKSGGMYDQLGGGFARYSTDERWAAAFRATGVDPRLLVTQTGAA